MRNLIKNTGLILGLILGLSVSLIADGNVDKSGTTSAQFLKIGVGARPMGLGGSFAAVSDDASSPYWNPAGMSQVKSINLLASNTQWFAGISHQYFSLVLPLTTDQSIAVHGVSLTMDPIEITTIENPHGINEFYEASDLYLGVSYAKKFTDYYTMGATIKYIQLRIHNETASTVALDVGSLLEIPYYGLKLGFHFSNFGGKLVAGGRDLSKEYDLNPDNTLNAGVASRLKTESWDLPVNFRMGLAMDLIGGETAPISSSSSRLTLSADGNHPADAAEYLALGVEYAFNELLFLRGGMRTNRDVENLFYGAGFRLPMGNNEIHFDYALAPFGQLENIHVVTGSLTF